MDLTKKILGICIFILVASTAITTFTKYHNTSTKNIAVVETHSNTCDANSDNHNSYYPNLKSLAIARFSASVSTLSNDLKTEMQRARPWYTKQGWEEFQDFFKSLGYYEALSKRTGGLLAFAFDFPVLLNIEDNTEQRKWTLNFHLAYQFNERGQTEKNLQYSLITLTLTEVLENGSSEFKIHEIQGKSVDTPRTLGHVPVTSTQNLEVEKVANILVSNMSGKDYDFMRYKIDGPEYIPYLYSISFQTVTGSLIRTLCSLDMSTYKDHYTDEGWTTLQEYLREKSVLLNNNELSDDFRLLPIKGPVTAVDGMLKGIPTWQLSFEIYLDDNNQRNSNVYNIFTNYSWITSDTGKGNYKISLFESKAKRIKKRKDEFYKRRKKQQMEEEEHRWKHRTTP